MRDAPRPTHHTGRPRLLLRLDTVRIGRFLVGVAIAGIEMEQPELARAVPMVAGLVVLIAGALQFTKWKVHYLSRCREASGRRGERACISDSTAASVVPT
jgi:hypothetical protein